MIARTLKNPNGFQIDFPTVRNAIRYIMRTSSRFGFKVLEVKTTPRNDFINADAIYNQLKHLVKAARKGNRNGIGLRYSNLALKLGVTLSAGIEFVGPLINTYANASPVTITWQAPVGVTAPVSYDYIFFNVTDAVQVAAATIAAGNPKTYTSPALTSGKQYRFQVRAKWTILGQQYITPYTTTLFTRP